MVWKQENSNFNVRYAEAPSLFEAFTLKVVPCTKEESTSTRVELIEINNAISAERGVSEYWLTN